MDDPDMSVLEDGAGDVPDGDTRTVDYRRFHDMYLYNSVEPSADFPASMHALSTAYDDLKKRFNELQTRHRIALRQIKRSSAPPDLNSPTSGHMSRINDLTNGDVSSWPSRVADSSTSQLEMQLCETQDENSQLKNLVRHQSQKIEDLEKRCTLLSERTQMISSMHSQQQNSMKQAQERYVALENENEDLRKQIVAREKKLRELTVLNDELNKEQCDHIAGLERKLQAIENEHFAQKEDKIKSDEFTVKSLADALSFMEVEESNVPRETKEGDMSLSTELEPLLHGMLHLQREILQLNDMVAKQQNVIMMLSSRQTETPLVARSISQNVSTDVGQGARPKVRSHSTNLPPQEPRSPAVRRNLIGQEQSMIHQSSSRSTLRESGSESALSDIYTQGIQRTSDRLSSSQETHVKDYVSPLSPAVRGNLNQVNMVDVRSGTAKRHSAVDLYSQRSPHLPVGDKLLRKDSFKQNKRHTVTGVALELDRDPYVDVRRRAEFTEDDNPFDHLNFGDERNVCADPVFDSGDLPALPAGFHRRHDSLEHLHDDDTERNEQNFDSDIIDVHSHDGQLSVTGTYETGQNDSFNMRDLSETEITMTVKEDNTRRLTPDGSVENRYRNTGNIGQQPRQIDIERNHCDTSSIPSNYDNTSANVNLNYQTSGKLKTDSTSTPYQVLNNNPLAGHKTIPIRNIYQGERIIEVADNGPPERRESEVLRSPPAGRTRNDSFLSRVCPVCEEDFGYTIPMEDFQHHVLDCLAVPNSSDSTTENDRVCPMCSEVFEHSVLQKDFEAHVNEHFEEEARSIVNEFEVVRPGTATTTS